MTKSEILRDKTILVVDDEPDVIDSFRDLMDDQADVIVHSATGFEEARQLLYSHNYDVVVLDIMGVRGFDLLEISTHSGFPTVMLTAMALNPEALKKSIDMGAKAYLPKTCLPDIVPFLEDVLRLRDRSVWRKAIDTVFELFDKKFGPEWRKSETEFWSDFEKTLAMDEPMIITKRIQDK
jgi:DNA-binding response OmpR family regulator